MIISFPNNQQVRSKVKKSTDNRFNNPYRVLIYCYNQSKGQR